ncbi:FMN-binding protein [Arthrobacter sp. UYCu712]|uniref:FMN-binding protein n=1 Tax=Arthrobacter sp. UYCu712 TaxID=3156340 RepID=UPI003396FFF4
MRIRAAVSAALASAGILLVGWQSGGQIAETASTATGSSAGSGGATSGSAGTSASGGTTGSSGASGPSGAAGSSGAAAKAAGTAGTYDGAVVQTRFGAVQVQITVQSGTITEVTALQLTDAERKSVQISNRAAPLLRAEVLKAQSASVQTISGATVTSVAYLDSLQAALDAANL